MSHKRKILNVELKNEDLVIFNKIKNKLANEFGNVNNSTVIRHLIRKYPLDKQIIPIQDQEKIQNDVPEVTS